jgi:hypothetical protein
VANDDYVHVAMPKLYGAPAYARPPVEPVARTERPLNPDDLPIESEQTDDERAMLTTVDGEGNAHMHAAELAAANNGAGRRSFGIRAIAGMFRGDKGSTTDAG